MIESSVRYCKPPKGGNNLWPALRRSSASLSTGVLLFGLIACRAGSHDHGGSRIGGRKEGPTRAAREAGTAREGDFAADDDHGSAPPELPPGEEQVSTGRIRTETVQRLSIKVLAVYPHDPAAFTQGLVWDGGLLYESTGLYGKSSLRRVEPASGAVLERRPLESNLFGEGLALVGDRLLQLTWKAGIVLVYDLASFAKIDEYGFNGQGWGLAFDGRRLVMSDGTHRLTVRDLDDFRWRATLNVTQAGKPVNYLNELEFAEGDLYANVWGEERILRIDPDSGQVNAVIDASSLLRPGEKTMVDVLNGIAYDPASKTFWLTGKFWTKIFQVVFESDTSEAT